MKKCPVCGVMMGDNVARCFMCKYDFQKAAREGEEAARKDATINVFQVEKEASGRAAEKKAEGEKIIADAKVKSRLEIEAMERQLEGEKLRLEQEYVEIRKKSLEERSKLDAELAAIRQKVEEENKLFQDARMDREKLIEGSKAAAQGEAEKIIIEIQEETGKLAIQVQEEYAAAMAEKQLIIDETSRLAAEVAAAKERFDKTQEEYEQQLHAAEQEALDAKRKAEQEVAEARSQAELEAVEIKRQAELDSAAKLAAAEESRRNAVEEAELIRLEIENTKKMAESELAAYVSEARAAIAEAEESQINRQKAEAEMKSIMEQAESYKGQAEEAKRKADEEARVIFLEVEETKKLAQKEEQEILLRAQEAKAKAEKDEQVYRDELELTQKQVQEEIENILEQRRAAWATAEQEAVALTQELQEARDMAKEALAAREAAEELAKEAQRVAAEDSERIILEAEKRAIVLKEIGISQSEKGRIVQQYEEESRVRQSEIADLQKALSAREQELQQSEQKVRDIMEEIEKLRNNQIRTGFMPVSVPMEYAVEIIIHKPTGEVDSEAIEEVLSRRGPQGWKLHSIMNDEGGRLQASMGAAEKYSLASGASYKEDRVIMIFERVAESISASNEETPSSPV
ncbi:MAG: hypothetical protein WCG21_14400 [Eubacteriales bacterium]